MLQQSKDNEEKVQPKEELNVKNVPILKAVSNKKIITIPYIKDLVGFSVCEVIRNSNEFNNLDINIFVKNLSKDILTVNLDEAYYVTNTGEQIQGGVRRVIIAGTDNRDIMPSLKIKLPIYFYNLVRDVYENDIIVIKLSIGKTIFTLSSFISNKNDSVVKV